MRKYQHMTRLARVLIACLLFGVTCFLQTTPLASAAATPVTCTSLIATASRSNSQNYTFSVKAAGAGSDINGYTIDFGDRQSYTFAFSRKTSAPQRLQATVTHTYKNLGVYNASAHINTNVNGKTNSVTSGDCQSTITLGPTQLVDTGAGNVPALFIATSLAGIVVFEVWSRLRPAPR